MTLLPKIHVDQVSFIFKKFASTIAQKHTVSTFDDTLNKVSLRMDAKCFCAIALAHFWMCKHMEIELET